MHQIVETGATQDAPVWQARTRYTYDVLERLLQRVEIVTAVARQIETDRVFDVDDRDGDRIDETHSNGSKHHRLV